MDSLPRLLLSPSGTVSNNQGILESHWMLWRASVLHCWNQEECRVKYTEVEHESMRREATLEKHPDLVPRIYRLSLANQSSQTVRHFKHYFYIKTNADILLSNMQKSQIMKTNTCQHCKCISCLTHLQSATPITIHSAMWRGGLWGALGKPNDPTGWIRNLKSKEAGDLPRHTWLVGGAAETRICVFCSTSQGSSGVKGKVTKESWRELYF